MRIALLVLTWALAWAPIAEAHYCSNIFAGPARFVVKPETTTLAVNGSKQLRVYLQNNFPYTLFGVELRGVATGYTIATQPTSRTIHPGQNVGYVLTVNGTGTASMTMQLKFRLGSWRGPTDKLVGQSPSQALLVGNGAYEQGSAEQTPSLNLGKLVDLYPSATLGAGAPTFGRTGARQLIKMFGYRYCWDEGGSWAGGSQDCPSPSAEQTWGSPSDLSQFPQDCMRAGVELGVRKAKLGSDLSAAQSAAVNALQGAGSAQHKCLAAVVGGHLWQGAGDISAFKSALQSSGNSVPTACQTAGLRAAGDNSTAQSCPSSPWEVAAACAAGEGLRNNDGPVTSILMPNSGDGESSASSQSEKSLFYAYMLYLVQGARRAAGGVVPFYPDAGAPIGTTPPPADTAPPPPKQDTKPPPGMEPQPPKLDTVPPPGVEAGPSPWQEGGPPNNQSPGSKLMGGCAMDPGVGPRGPAIAILALLALVAALARRRSG